MVCSNAEIIAKIMNTPWTAASDLNSNHASPPALEVRAADKRAVLLHRTSFSATQLPAETKVTPVGKSNSRFDL